MSFDNPFGEFGGDFGGFTSGMFADVLKMMRAQDPSHLELVSQLALSVAGDPNEPNIEPKDRIATEELSRVAELHVADVTGMSVVPSGASLSVQALSRTSWVTYSLSSWRKTLEALIGAQATSAQGTSAQPDLPGSDLESFGEHGDEFARALQGWLTMLAPTLAAMQVGSIVGHLATRTLGQHDLLLPGDFRQGPAAVPRNRRQFATDWSLPENDVVLWTATNDICLHAVLSRAHVSARLFDLVVAHASSMRIDPSALQEQLGSLAGKPPSDMAELAELFNDPGSLLGAADTDEARWHRQELETLVTVIRGYADWVTRTVAARAIGAASAIGEAMARARVDRSEYERAADGLIGVDQSPSLYERGRRFIEGVIEREGESDLARLWIAERNLPTPAELDAPGLWLERIKIDEGSTG